jgi:hypothetical protein
VPELKAIVPIAALRVQSSDTVWALQGNPGTVDIAEGSLKGVARGSSLKLPTIGSQARFD